jgi:hypothetical protein
MLSGHGKWSYAIGPILERENCEVLSADYEIWTRSMMHLARALQCF